MQAPKRLTPDHFEGSLRGPFRDSVQIKSWSEERRSNPKGNPKSNGIIHSVNVPCPHVGVEVTVDLGERDSIRIMFENPKEDPYFLLEDQKPPDRDLFQLQRAVCFTFKQTALLHVGNEIGKVVVVGEDFPDLILRGFDANLPLDKAIITFLLNPDHRPVIRVIRRAGDGVHDCSQE